MNTRRKKPSLSRISSQQFLMTTILEEPYMMLRKAKPGELLRGNDRYEGYCKVVIMLSDDKSFAIR